MLDKVDRFVHHVYMSTAYVQPSSGITWSDPRRKFWTLGLIVPLLPFAAGGMVAATGSAWWWWLGPVLVYLLMPLLDTVLGRDSENPPEEVVKQLDADHFYRWVTYAYIPVQYGALVYGCWVWSSDQSMSWFAKLGLAITIGVVGGVAINTAHELGHKHPRLEQWLSKIALAQTGYGHFFIEHNRGHHANVSTPLDPASSRFGESFYEFLPRTVVGSLRSALRLERQRCQRTNTPFWSLRNEIFNAWLMTVVLFGALIAVFGTSIVALLLVQAVFGFSLLEVVNYVEHYGLLRRQKADGRYERCKPEHSWNANHAASNMVLYQLQRHSDHHANPTRRYQSLRHFDDVPQLPTGYAGMIVCAYIPPLFRKVMDHRVLDFYDGDPSKVNLHRRIQRKLGSDV